MSNICLISKWKLKNGVSNGLLKDIEDLVEKVQESEKNTLMYRVNFKARTPLDSYDNVLESNPGDIPHDELTEVIFLEIYEDAQAFSDHVQGEVFNDFRKKTLEHFQPDPMKEGWPLTDTEFLSFQHGFVRDALWKEELIEYV